VQAEHIAAPPTPPVAAGPVTVADLKAVLAGGDLLQLVFQPIVDLFRGVVVGHEVLSRFPQRPGIGPDSWFAAAEAAGLGPQLNAQVVAGVVRLLPVLPENTFITVNVDPQALLSGEVNAVLRSAPTLARLVIEITEHSAVEDFDDVLHTLTRWRERGAKIALDDVGSGYAGLQALLRLRPEIVKMDRALVDGMDFEPAKRAVVEMLGYFAGDLDAWLLAEGLERLGELHECLRLDVPLGQGWLFGRPSLGWTETVPGPVRRAVVAQANARVEQGTIRRLVEPAPTVTAEQELADNRPEPIRVLVDGFGRPRRLYHRTAPAEPYRGTDPLLVKATEQVGDLARRAVARGANAWHEPIVCCAGDGTYLGVVRVDRLVDALVRAATNRIDG
jgi:EAL domain-containing protein (putative c-di-GMP-specific phosphodiesterase class I)